MMDALILDANKELLAVVDTYKSFIWTERYGSYGDFELYVPLTMNNMTLFSFGSYVVTRDSNKLMTIESVQSTSDEEEGKFLTVTGRSYESVLDRRIVWNKTTLKGNYQNGIKRLLTENAISPSDPKRKIPGLIFRDSTDPKITSLTLEETQFYGEDLLDITMVLCAEKNLGFRVDPDEEGNLVFELYFGADRSYAQNINPWVVFSPNYENLLSSNYLESKKTLKNVILASSTINQTETDSEGNVKTKEVIRSVEVSSETAMPSGLARREIFGEASLSTTDDEGNELTEAEYLALLRSEASRALTNHPETVAFEGEVDATRQFVYGRDFFLGDIVQVSNEFGMEGYCRISEIVRSNDENGEIITPTFVFVDASGSEIENTI